MAWAYYRVDCPCHTHAHINKYTLLSVPQAGTLLVNRARSPTPLAHIFYRRMTLPKKVPRDLQESIDELARKQLRTTDRRGYEHEAANSQSPIVWIPKDSLGISEDEIAYAEDCVSDIRIMQTVI